MGVATSWTSRGSSGLAGSSPGNKGGRRGVRVLFGFNGGVARGDRGARLLAQTTEESERRTRGRSGCAGTVAYSAALSPPSPAPARCSTVWPQELQRLQTV